MKWECYAERYISCPCIPKHFFENIPEDLNLKFNKNLFKIGWKQSSPLRNALFEDTTVFNLISLAESYTYQHDKIFLSILSNYFQNTNKGSAKVLKPLFEDHILIDALEEFKNRNDIYFDPEKKYIEPIPFIYDKLENCSGWGLVSIFHLPIIYNYSIKSLNILLKDIETIKSEIEYLGEDKGYKLPDIEGYGNTGGNVKYEVKVEKADKLKDLMEKTFHIDKSKINLNSREFSNLLLIKNERR